MTTETKAQRLARKFGRSPKPNQFANGAPPIIERRRTATKTQSSPAKSLRQRLQRQFHANCTLCFGSVLARMEKLEPQQIIEQSEDLAKSVYENAKERHIGALLAWANYRANGLRLYQQLVLDAAEPFKPAPSVDAMFVWLYYDAERQSDELRWSIRSVLANYNGNASVILFGDKPGWYSGPHVPIPRVGPQHRRRYRDTLNKLYAACTSPLVPDTFVWMMDDTYFLRKVSMRDLSVNRYQNVIPPKPWGNREWRGMQQDSYKAIREAGLQPVDYCTHLPKVVEKQKFLEIWERFGLAKRVLQWELLYGACFYENYRPVDGFFGLIRNVGATDKIRHCTVVNNGRRGWSERLRAELWNRFPVQSQFEIASAAFPKVSSAPRYNFEIRKGYRCRAENNVGIAVPDNAQRNVYQYAATIPNVSTVIDWGTGSGAKLVEFFPDKNAIGVDVPEKVTAAKSRFPAGDWRILPTEIDCDLLIVADVIEHLADPLSLVATIKAGKWKHCVISTPERDLARGVNDLGPPKNPRHVREWNTGEFVRFIRKQNIGQIDSVRVLGEYNLVIHLTKTCGGGGCCR